MDIVGVLAIIIGVMALYLKNGLYIGVTYWYPQDPMVMVYLAMFAFAFCFFCFALAYVEGRKQLPQHI
jgi:hypothetical protein